VKSGSGQGPVIKHAAYGTLKQQDGLVGAAVPGPPELPALVFHFAKKNAEYGAGSENTVQGLL